MKRLLTLSLLLLPAIACAQTVTYVPRQPVDSNTVNSLQQLLQQSMTPEQQAKLQQGMVAMTIVNCARGQVGDQAAQDYYTTLTGISKQARAYCKAGQSDQARQYILQQLHAHQNDPQMKAAQACYDQHTADIATIPEPTRGDVVKYVRWSRDPNAADREMTNEDICKSKKPKES